MSCRFCVVCVCVCLDCFLTVMGIIVPFSESGEMTLNVALNPQCNICNDTANQAKNTLKRSKNGARAVESKSPGHIVRSTIYRRVVCSTQIQCATLTKSPTSGFVACGESLLRVLPLSRR